MANQVYSEMWAGAFNEEESNIPMITKSDYFDLDGLIDKMNNIDDNKNLSILNLNVRSLIKKHLRI